MKESARETVYFNFFFIVVQRFIQFTLHSIQEKGKERTVLHICISRWSKKKRQKQKTTEKHDINCRMNCENRLPHCMYLAMDPLRRTTVILFYALSSWRQRENERREGGGGNSSEHTSTWVFGYLCLCGGCSFTLIMWRLLKFPLLPPQNNQDVLVIFTHTRTNRSYIYFVLAINIKCWIIRFTLEMW